MRAVSKSEELLFCGDPHAGFRHIVELAGRLRPQAVILLGDMEPPRALQDEMVSLTRAGVPWYFIAGNHDADSDVLAERVWNAGTEPFDLHGRVVTLPSGLRLAGLAGVFREAVYYPTASSARAGVPAFHTREEHAVATPRQDRWKGGPHRKHLGTIYPSDIDRLADMQADVLVCHEASGYHPNGFSILDTLAQSMGVKVLVHGHQHDALPSRELWAGQGFASIGVGLRGVTGVVVDTASGVRIKVVRKGELDDERGRHRGIRGGARED